MAQVMSAERTTSYYLATHECFILAFCADCNHFVAASTELGRIAIAARAHRCYSRIGQSRKSPKNVDPADYWLKTSGVIA
jgi:hypothetical protein